jgi:dihydrofolate reductase
MSAALVLVVAVAKNGVIGAHGGLPWRIRADLKKFRAVTMGKPLLMGRKTFDSIGRVLDGRDSIVVTRRSGLAIEGAFVVSTLEAGLALAYERAAARGADEICVIGGGEIFRETLPTADRLYVTHVDAAPVGDVFFPEISPAAWVEMSREPLPRREGDTASGIFAVYDRR